MFASEKVYIKSPATAEEIQSPPARSQLRGSPPGLRSEPQSSRSQQEIHKFIAESGKT